MRVLPLTLLLFACAGPDLNEPSPVEPSAPSPTTRTTEPAPVPTPEPNAAEVRVVPIGAALAEDGAGAQRQSATAVAIDIETQGWPGRAMDPVLVVGDHHFTAYTHVSPTVLRYVAAAPELLPEGTEAVVRYGQNEVARFTLPPVTR